MENTRRRPPLGELTHFLDFSNRRLRWLPVLMVAVLFAAGVIAWLVHPAPGVTVSGGKARVGAPAPEFKSTTPKGAPVRLRDFRGSPVLINFWATWCTACEDEMPAIQSAVQQHSADHVQVLAVDYRETDRAAMTRYLSRLHVRFEPALDPEGKIAAAYGVSIGLPVSVFVDRDGVVRFMHTGQMSPPIIEQGIRASSR